MPSLATRSSSNCPSCSSWQRVVWLAVSVSTQFSMLFKAKPICPFAGFSVNFVLVIIIKIIVNKIYLILLIQNRVFFINIK